MHRLMLLTVYQGQGFSADSSGIIVFVVVDRVKQLDVSQESVMLSDRSLSTRLLPCKRQLNMARLSHSRSKELEHPECVGMRTHLSDSFVKGV
jgi:hypothetical protein